MVQPSKAKRRRSGTLAWRGSVVLATVGAWAWGCSGKTVVDTTTIDAGHTGGQAGAEPEAGGHAGTGGAGADAGAGGSGGAPPTCAHDICEPGNPLNPLCHPCVEQICSGDDYCCIVKWDDSCVDAVEHVCSITC